MTKKGLYAKVFDIRQDDAILIYLKKHDEGKDNRHYIMNDIIKSYAKYNNYNGFQPCEEKEEKNNFKIICYIVYSFSGEILKHIFVYFDFDNSIITVNNNKYKVKDDFDYVYKVQKTQIKAIKGIEGLYNHIVETMNIDEYPGNNLTYKMLSQL